MAAMRLDVAMTRPWWKRGRVARPAVSADFHHALMQEVLRTELVRVKVILMTLTVLFAILTAGYLIFPASIERIWHGHFPLASLCGAFLFFALFELSVMRMIGLRLKQRRDVPHARRYLG